MDIKQLKNFLYENPDKLQFVLEESGLNHIKKHSGNDDHYLTMGNPDGDNKTAITVYLSPSLLTINYTREMCPNKHSCDVIDLICFARGGNFFDNLKFIAETSGISYYQNFKDDMPESLRIIREIKKLLNKETVVEEDDDTPIVPKQEGILNYYFPYSNIMFEADGIPSGIQRQFEVGYDLNTNRIVIPVRDEIGNIVGIKARYFEKEVPENELKYFYLEKFPKGKILYGYFYSKDHIKESDHVLIGESEKSFMQMWSQGYKNSIATGGTKMARPQIDKLSRLGKKLILCFDKDFTEDKIQILRDKFLPYIDFHAMIDRENILSEKQSPSDDEEKFKYLLKHNIYKIEKTIE